ncbi:MAG: flippase [Flammeovirgaceae bacterium]|nr:flippase [Flammeovirgaceae bacterium]
MSSFSFLNNTKFVKLFKNSLWLLFDYVFRLIAGYFVSIWLAREIGPENFGIYNFALANIAILVTLSMVGLQGLGIHLLVEKRENEAKNLGTLFFIRISAAIFLYTLLLLFCLIFEIKSIKIQLTLLMGLKVFFSSFNVIEFYFDAIIQARYKVIARTLSYTIRTVLLVGFIVYNLPLIYLGGIVVFEEIIAVVGSIYFYYKKSNISIFSWKRDIKLMQRVLLDAWPLVISSAGIIIYLKVDQVMIVQMVSSEAGGYYAVASKITELFNFLPPLIITSVFPILIEAKKRSQANYEFKLKNLLRLLILTSLIICLSVTLLSKYIILYTYGEQYVEAHEILKIHIWTLYFSYIGVVLSRWLIIERFTQASLVRNLLGLTINVVLNFLLIPIYGAIGAAVTSIISLAFAVVIFAFYSKKTLGFLQILISSLNILDIHRDLKR